MPVARFQADEPTRALERLVLSERCLARGIYDPDALRALVGAAAAFERGLQVFTLASLEPWLRVNVDDVPVGEFVSVQRRLLEAARHPLGRGPVRLRRFA